MKNKFRFRLCCVYMLTPAIADCKVKRPDDIISESKIENLLYDYHLAGSTEDNLPYNEDYRRTLYLDAVFKKYGTAEAVFGPSLVQYTRNTEVLLKIYEEVSRRPKTQQSEINRLMALRDSRPRMSEPGDNIDIWSWKRLVRLTGKMMNDQYVFVLSADTNYKNRDTLVWEVCYHFLEPILADFLRAVTMAIQVTYKKGTLNCLETITDPDVHQLRLYADTLGVMREVKGFIYYPGVQEEKAGALLADRFPLTRYHCSYSLSVVERDSINQLEALRTDSLKRVSDQEDNRISRDSLQKVDDPKDNQRISPEEMNRRHTMTPEKKPEQIEVEQHIRQEKVRQRGERQLDQRRNQQRRQSPPR